MSGRNEWPANADDVPVKRIHWCTCGMASTAPINHPQCKPKPPKEQKCR